MCFRILKDEFWGFLIGESFDLDGSKNIRKSIGARGNQADVKSSGLDKLWRKRDHHFWRQTA